MYFYLVLSSCNSKTRYTFSIPRSCVCRFMFFHSVQKGQKIFPWLCDMPWLFSTSEPSLKICMMWKSVWTKNMHWYTVIIWYCRNSGNFWNSIVFIAYQLENTGTTFQQRNSGGVRRWPWDSSCCGASLCSTYGKTEMGKVITLVRTRENALAQGNLLLVTPCTKMDAWNTSGCVL